MLRRDFFRALALGAAVTPTAFRAATVPVTTPLIVRAGQTLVNATIVGRQIVMEHGSMLLNCVIRRWGPGPSVRIDSQGATVTIRRCLIENSRPLWARLLGVGLQNEGISASSVNVAVHLRR